MRVIAFDLSLLKVGSNVIRLYHADAVPFARFTAVSTDAGVLANTTPGQVMYDALRLEVEPAASQ